MIAGYQNSIVTGHFVPCKHYLHSLVIVILSTKHIINGTKCAVQCHALEFCTLVWLIFSKKNGHKESQPAKKNEVARRLHCTLSRRKKIKAGGAKKRRGTSVVKTSTIQHNTPRSIRNGVRGRCVFSFFPCKQTQGPQLSFCRWDIVLL